METSFKLKITTFVQRFRAFAHRWAKLNLIILFFFFIFCIAQLPQLKSHLTTRTIIDPTSKSALDYEYFESIFPSNNSLLILFKGDMTNEKNLCFIEKWIQKQNLENDGILKINNPLQLREVINTSDNILFPPFFPLQCQDSVSPVAIDLKRLEATPWKNTFITPNGNALIVDFVLRDADSMTKYGPIHPKQIETIKKSLDETFSLSGLQYFLTGSLGGFYYTYIGVSFNNMINAAFLIFIILIFRLFFGTYRSGLIYSATLIVMGGMLYGLISLFGGSMNVLNGSLFLMVSISAIEDFVFICSEKIKMNSPLDHIFEKLTAPSFFTSLTTIFGFASLCITDLKIIRDFGFWAALGSALEWLILFYFLPSFLNLFPRFKDNWTNDSKAPLQKVFQSFSLKKISLKLLFPLLLVFVTAFYSLNLITVEDSPSRIFPEKNIYKQSLKFIKEEFGWEAPAHILFYDSENRTLNEKIIKEVTKDFNIAQIESPYDIIDYYTKDLPPLRQDLVLRNLKNSSAYRKVISPDHQAQARLMLKDTNVNKIQSLSLKIEELCEHGKHCIPTGQLFAYADFFSKTSKVLIESLVTSLILVSFTLFLLAYLLKIPHKIFLILSALWGPFLMINLFGFFHIPLNLLTCVFASIIIGLTGDNAIYYMFESEGEDLEKGINFRGNGSIEIVTIMFICTLIFQVSYFESARTLGLLVGLGMIASLIGDLWILKALLDFQTKRALKKFKLN